MSQSLGDSLQTQAAFHVDLSTPLWFFLQEAPSDCITTPHSLQSGIQCLGWVRW